MKNFYAWLLHYVAVRVVIISDIFFQLRPYNRKALSNFLYSEAVHRPLLVSVSSGELIFIIKIYFVKCGQNLKLHLLNIVWILITVQMSKRGSWVSEKGEYWGTRAIWAFLGVRKAVFGLFWREVKV